MGVRLSLSLQVGSVAATRLVNSRPFIPRPAHRCNKNGGKRMNGCVLGYIVIVFLVQCVARELQPLPLPPDSSSHQEGAVPGSDALVLEEMNGGMA